MQSWSRGTFLGFTSLSWIGTFPIFCTITLLCELICGWKVTPSISDLIYCCAMATIFLYFCYFQLLIDEKNSSLLLVYDFFIFLFIFNYCSIASSSFMRFYICCRSIFLRFYSIILVDLSCIGWYCCKIRWEWAFVGVCLAVSRVVSNYFYCLRCRSAECFFF